MPSSPTYYDFFGVRQNASFEEIRSAYLWLMKQHHPDRSGQPDRQRSADFAAMVNRCYAVLKDPATFGEYQLSYRAGDIVSPRIDASEPLSMELRDFSNAICTGGVPRSSAALGYFRAPSWSVPILAVICGVISDKFIDESSVTGLLEKAHNANQRGGFLIVVYFVICAIGYIVGGYGRFYLRSKSAPAVEGKK